MNAYNRYCFFFAHPDDEIYCCALIQRLMQSGKQVQILYATSGDGAGFPEKREQEALDSLAHCGVRQESIHFLRIPEHQVLSHLDQLIRLAQETSASFQPEVLIGHDYEGGHEAHDALCYCASELVRKAGIPHFFTFPLYHGKPQERQGARFKPSRTNFLTNPLSDKEGELKRLVMSTHASQYRHFEGLQKSAPDYMDLLCSREVFYEVKQSIDFSMPPMEEIGYEFHRNGFTFQDFQAAISQ